MQPRYEKISNSLRHCHPSVSSAPPIPVQLEHATEQ
jgi:hypothetical protein